MASLQLTAQRKSDALAILDESTAIFMFNELRAKKTLKIFLKNHADVPVFVDDRLIERCYGELQGKSKRKLAAEKPEWFAQVHRGYDFPPPEAQRQE